MMPYNASELQLDIRLHYLKKNERKKSVMLRRITFLLFISFLTHSGLGQETSVELLDTIALLFQIKKWTKEKFLVF